MDGVNLRQKVFVRMLARYCHFQKKKGQMKPTQLMQWKSRRICISRQKYYAKQNLVKSVPLRNASGGIVYMFWLQFYQHFSWHCS